MLRISGMTLPRVSSAKPSSPRRSVIPAKERHPRVTPLTHKSRRPRAGGDLLRPGTINLLAPSSPRRRGSPPGNRVPKQKPKPIKLEADHENR
jgi:hypothetical protein